MISATFYTGLIFFLRTGESSNLEHEVLSVLAFLTLCCFNTMKQFFYSLDIPRLFTNEEKKPYGR